MSDADALIDDRERQEEPEENFAELLEQSMARPARLEPGRRIAAKVLKVGAEWVFLDVGQKGEGVLDLKELLDDEGRTTVATGETLPVYFLGNEDGELRPDSYSPVSSLFRHHLRFIAGRTKHKKEVANED